MDKKYELLKNDIITVNGKTLYRIKALKDFGNVKTGDLGGYIEKEDNLSQDGNAWVFGNAKVFGDAEVYGDAMVYDDARVGDDAKVYGDARVGDDAWVYGNAWVYGDAMVYDDARVGGNAKVFSNAWVYGDAMVYDDARVYGNAEVHGNANISSIDDYAVIQGFGSENRSTTFFKCKDNSIKVSCGCFEGTIDEFENKVKETHGDNKYAKEYLTIVDLAKIHFEIN